MRENNESVLQYSCTYIDLKIKKSFAALILLFEQTLGTDRWQDKSNRQKVFLKFEYVYQFADVSKKHIIRLSQVDFLYSGRACF